MFGFGGGIPGGPPGRGIPHAPAGVGNPADIGYPAGVNAPIWGPQAGGPGGSGCWYTYPVPGADQGVPGGGWVVPGAAQGVPGGGWVGT